MACSPAYLHDLPLAADADVQLGEPGVDLDPLAAITDEELSHQAGLTHRSPLTGDTGSADGRFFLVLSVIETSYY